MLPDILRDRPLMFWAVVFMLVPLGALVFPLDWADTGQTTFLNSYSRLNAFSPKVAEIDRSLQSGKRVELTASELREIRPYLQARRLTRAGSMSQNEVQRAVGLMQKRRRRVGRESSTASKRAVRRFWNERLAETFPRLERSDIAFELRKLRLQIDERVHVVSKQSSTAGSR